MELAHTQGERDGAIKRAQVAEDERDAMLANMQAVHNAASQLMMASSADEADEALAAMNQAMSEHPSESLARLRDQWQAQALDWAADKADEIDGGPCQAGRVIGQRADELRREADTAGEGE